MNNDKPDSFAFESDENYPYGSPHARIERSPLNRRRWRYAFCGFRATIGSVVGTILTPLLLAVTAAGYGGVFRLSPCHPAPDFVTGAVFGAAIFVYEFGVPSIVVGAVLGFVLSGIRKPRNATGR